MGVMGGELRREAWDVECGLGWEDGESSCVNVGLEGVIGVWVAGLGEAGLR